jgi:hypothetical protein
MVVINAGRLGGPARNGQQARRGEGRAAPGAAQGGSERCRLAVHSSSSGAAFTPSLSSCALGQPRHHLLYEGAPDIREACLGADLPDTEQLRRHLAAVDAMLQGE